MVVDPFFFHFNIDIPFEIYHNRNLLRLVLKKTKNMFDSAIKCLIALVVVIYTCWKKPCTLLNFSPYAST